MTDHLLFCTHALLIEQDAIFAAGARRELGLKSVALVHGSKDAATAERLGFDRVLNIGTDARPGREEPATSEVVARLAALEKDFPTRPLREDILGDRWLRGRFSMDWSLRYLDHVYNVVDPLLDSIPIVAGFGEVNYAAYRLVRRLLAIRGIPYIQSHNARMFERFYLDTTLYSEWPRCVDLYEEFRTHGVPAEVESPAHDALARITVQRKGTTYSEAFRRKGSEGEEGLGSKVRRVAARVARAVRRSGPDHGSAWPAHQLPSEANPVAGLGRWIRSRRGRRYYATHSADVSGEAKYALYLLHVSPEYTVDTLGWPFRDQLTLIRRIVESLPIDMTLRVKEHVPSIGLRETDFYRELAGMDGVTLVPARADTNRLIRDCSILFTISGTAAIEAMALEVPAVTFSRVFHSNFRGIHRCTDLFDIPAIVQRALSSDAEMATREDALAAFAAIFAASHPGRLAIPIYEWNHKENVENLQAGFAADLRNILAGALRE